MSRHHFSRVGAAGLLGAAGMAAAGCGAGGSEPVSGSPAEPVAIEYWSGHTGTTAAAQTKVAVDQMPRAQQCDAAYAMGNLNSIIETALRGIFVDNKPAAVAFRDAVVPLETEVAPFVQLLKSMK